jgi:hypothetical protein
MNISVRPGKKERRINAPGKFGTVNHDVHLVSLAPHSHLTSSATISPDPRAKIQCPALDLIQNHGQPASVTCLLVTRTLLQVQGHGSSSEKAATQKSPLRMSHSPRNGMPLLSRSLPRTTVFDRGARHGLKRFTKRHFGSQIEEVKSIELGLGRS